MSTITQIITTPPEAPSRQYPTTFADKADTFVAYIEGMDTELNALSGQINTVASEINTYATNASNSATTATTKASEASTSATNAANSASTATTAATNAANSYDAFDDRYLGSKTSDPTLDNDGNALITGALYFNSANATMRVWTGSTWVASYLPASAYQETLISGTNIKTINSTSVLGSGNIATGDVVGQASSVDSELALFSGTGGKTIKRASTTGLLKATSGVLSAATVRTDYAEPTTALATGLLKNTTSTGAHTIAVAGTDYQAPIGTISGIVKGNGTNALTAATSGTDYVSPTGSDGIVTRQMLKDCGYTFLDKGNSGTTTQTLDYTAGSHQKITATGNHTISLSNFPPSGNLGELLLELVNGGAYTITLPTVNWIKPDGTTTTTWSTYLAANTGRTALQTSGTDFIFIWSRDGGSTYYGRLV